MDPTQVKSTAIIHSNFQVVIIDIKTILTDLNHTYKASKYQIPSVTVMLA